MAQTFGLWQPVPIPDLMTQPGEFIYSENLDLLVYTGFFQRQDGTRYIAGYDGNTWQHVLESYPWGGGFKAMVDYQDGLLISGGAECGVGETFPYLSYFDGEVEHCPWEFNGSIAKLKWVNDTLYALGYFNEIDGVPVYRMAKLVDGVWEGLLNPELEQDFDFAHFNDIEFYEGKLYVAGNIESDVWPQDLATIENGELVQVGTGLVGAWTSVGSLRVFNNELYIIGGIPYIQGNVGNHIVKWDGEEISPVGELIYDLPGQFATGAIRDAVVLDDYLYVGGSFAGIGNEDIALFARWDGSQWCSMEAEGFGSATWRCNKFGNEIIRLVFDVMTESGEAMPIWKLDVSDYVSSTCTEPLSISVAEKVSFRLFPNPAETFTTISSAIHHIDYLTLFDLQGRLLHEAQPRALNYRLSLEGLPAGMYVLQVQVGNELGRVKLVVE